MDSRRAYRAFRFRFLNVNKFTNVPRICDGQNQFVVSLCYVHCSNRTAYSRAWAIMIRFIRRNWRSKRPFKSDLEIYDLPLTNSTGKPRITRGRMSQIGSQNIFQFSLRKVLWTFIGPPSVRRSQDITPENPNPVFQCCGRLDSISISGGRGMLHL